MQNQKEQKERQKPQKTRTEDEMPKDPRNPAIKRRRDDEMAAEQGAEQVKDEERR